MDELKTIRLKQSKKQNAQYGHTKEIVKVSIEYAHVRL